MPTKNISHKRVVQIVFVYCMFQKPVWAKDVCMGQINAAELLAIVMQLEQSENHHC